MREMIHAFRGLDHEVKVLIMGGDQADAPIDIPYRSSPLKSAVRAILPTVLWQSIKDWKLISFDKAAKARLQLVAEHEHPDLIYERGSYLMTGGVEVADRLGIKHVLELNAPCREEKLDLEGSSLLMARARKAERKMVEETNLLVLVSSALKQFYSKEYPFTAEKTVVTPNAVDPKKIVVDPSVTSELVERYGLAGATVIGFVGSIFPYHGVDNLVRSFAEIHRLRKGCKLLIIGDGKVLPELKELASQLQVDQDVVFTGNVEPDQIYNHIELMDITVLARTKDYMSPIKIFEYGALGKAIIVPPTTAVRDVMTHDQDALFTGVNYDDLTTTILKLVDDVPFRQRIGKNFQNKVLEHHTWTRMAQRILNSLA